MKQLRTLGKAIDAMIFMSLSGRFLTGTSPIHAISIRKQVRMSYISGGTDDIGSE
jgi:hypothetical protein